MGFEGVLTLGSLSHVLDALVLLGCLLTGALGVIGATNLMTESRGTAETAGKAEPLSEKELSRLLDRTQLYETDEAFCVTDLLGEVRAGIAAETAAEARPEEQEEEQYGPCPFLPQKTFC